MAGVAAAQTLSNSSVHDFLILEYRDRIGGRAWHEPFGKDKDGKPYTIEMGCNWVSRSCVRVCVCRSGADSRRSKGWETLVGLRIRCGLWWVLQL